MSLPKSYLTSIKNLVGIFSAIQTVQAPKRFSTRFLESLDYKSNSDRLVIGVLKSLDFLSDDGAPKERYYEYLDQTRGPEVLAEGIKEAYADLFQVNIHAHKMSRAKVVNKFKTLSQGQYSESVLEKMAMTFFGLCKLADFDVASEAPVIVSEELVDQIIGVTGSADKTKTADKIENDGHPTAFELGDLHYNIQLILPESRDPKVYDALFRSLKDHILS